MQKSTKIVATIGPATLHKGTLRELYAAGMNVARINLSHGDRSTQAESIQNLRHLDPHFPIILDTKGPEIRTGRMPSAPLNAVAGTEVRLMYGFCQPAPDAICIDYPYLQEIAPGKRILFDDGLVESEVVHNSGDQLIVRITNSGPIGSGKKVTIQQYRTKLPFLTEHDQEDIRFAVQHGVRLLAASFVRCAQDVQTLRAFIARQGAGMMIIAKIENSDAVTNIKEIIAHADGVMVARGDLGVELPLEEVPGIQEKIIRYCNQAGKPVIVATQMLESMRENPRPTRAEVNDVAQAIQQGADAVMLSAETATGRYPVRSVAMMARIALTYEKRVKSIIHKYRRQEERGQVEIAQYIAKAAYYAAHELDAKAILTPTESGFTARNVARFKPACPVLASTRDPMVLQLLHLVWGVFPMLDTEGFLELPHLDMRYRLISHFFQAGILTLKDRIIITSGSNLMVKRGTNLLEIYAVGDIIRNSGLQDENGQAG